MATKREREDVASEIEGVAAMARGYEFAEWGLSTALRDLAAAVRAGRYERGFQRAAHR